MVERKEPAVNDFVMMNEVSEDNLMDVLAARYSADFIYTYIGDVIVSVNPYKQLDIYTAANIKAYNGKLIWTVSPHIYALANEAYRHMIQNQENQCVIISGESGAGKTEASKILMQFIVAVSKSSEKVEVIKQMLLDSNPVLEAFGNAKTIRNDNSSRFGKYMEIQFSKNGTPIGGKITNYLLEKSRVVSRALDERSFHIFYQMLAGLPPAKLANLSLTQDPSAYKFLSCSNCTTVPTLNDNLNFKSVCYALKTFGFSEDEMWFMWRTIAVILHLGNVNIVQPTDSQSCNIENPAVVKIIADLMQVGASQLEKSLLYRSITTGNKTESVIEVPLDASQAYFARDALAKNMYAKLFLWLVSRLNAKIQCKAPARDCLFIGVLDIYGFEIFEENSFEQFCINLCNEKLQQVHIELTLKTEQECYLKEGIKWEPVKYFDNKLICDLIERKPMGIIPLLDEECLLSIGDDSTFLQKLNKHLAHHPHFCSCEKDIRKDKVIPPMSFKLRHYAGDVVYKVEGFMQKNTDSFFSDLSTAVQSSKDPLVAALFPQSQSKDSNKRMPTSIATQFKDALNALISTLMSCQPHYIRCIKPNDLKRPNELDEERVRNQVRYLGLVENVRVRRAGFANRQSYQRFIHRYKMTCPDTWPTWQGEGTEGARLVMQSNNIASKEYLLGKTMIFIRNPNTLWTLEGVRDKILPSIVTLIQATWRGFQVRLASKRRKAAIVIQKVWRGYRVRKQWKRDRAATKILFAYRGAKALKWVRTLGALYANVKSDPNRGKSVSWPQPPVGLTWASKLVHDVYRNWKANVMVRSLTVEQQKVMRQKVIAYSLMSKPWDIQRKFQCDYLEDDRSNKKNYTALMNTFLVRSGDSHVCFADYVMKISRNGKAQRRVMMITDRHLYKHDARSYKVKNTVKLTNIEGVSMSRNTDAFIVVHVKAPEPDLFFECYSSKVNKLAEVVAALAGAFKACTGRDVVVHFGDSVLFNNGRPKGHDCRVDFTNDASLAGVLFKKVKPHQYLVAAPPGSPGSPVFVPPTSPATNSPASPLRASTVPK
eukprot:TRINITY_DN7065_c0_g1_i1.p1 TRINITY_DN7065_c0_g1~~TRINITY_DN7065_c0_g1_i1.p1  ORF type:complete len:1063 (+),score=234.56 TRINITY_DN7065_c0_g1_i1:40-3189(+)